ncbi:serpin family protein [Pigeonpox virus]|uniref:Serpin family protein n=1 Tax=Pigeonpox virus TaxID=10264 RepID=A0A068EGT1_9POXV|nr:serpin family protein [Pigeonpox virus]AID46558.1 serpin family protein [Pigeonpox virus]WCL39999.1 serpin family protein [Pigeonpox virus]
MSNISSINNKLAFISTKFYELITKRIPDRNIVISPPSILLIVKMLLRASTDRSRNQLLDLLYMLPLDDDEDDDSNTDRILKELLSRTEYTSMFFIDHSKRIHDSYNKYVSKSNITSLVSGDVDTLYNKMRELNYSAEEILSSIRRTPESIILFSIKYSDLWESPFSDNDSHKFFVTKYLTKVVPYIITSGMFGHMYCHEIKSNIINIPYLHNTYSMLLFFADTYKNFKYLEKHITPRILLSSKLGLNNMKYSEISVSIPKFSIQTQHNIKSVFVELGITDIFDENSSMKSVSPDKFSVTNLYVKSQVDFINNKVILGDQKKWEEISNNNYHINRPFIFVIKYNKTGSVVFMGKVKDPE